ncbi:MAG: hypothetical protein ACJASV_001941 [Pseudorhodobacter sp.]
MAGSYLPPAFGLAQPACFAAMMCQSAPESASQKMGNPPVQDIIQPLIPKAQVTGLRLAVASSGLSMGDKAELHLAEDGQVMVYAITQRPLLFWSRRKLRQLGYLGAQVSETLTAALRKGDALRVRIVGLTPEHLAADGVPELYVSVWGSAPLSKMQSPALTEIPPPLQK